MLHLVLDCCPQQNRFNIIYYESCGDIIYRYFNLNEKLFFGMKNYKIHTLQYFTTLLQELLYNYYHYNDVFSGFITSYLRSFIVFYILRICQVMYFTICIILLRVHIIPMLLSCNSNCPSIIAHYDSHFKFNLKSINPLTTHEYYHTNIKNIYTVYPALQPSTFPFNNVLNHDFEVYDSQNDNSNPVQDSELNEDRTDYSELANIDPDKNFLISTKYNQCLYYNYLSFNESFPKQNNFSVYHVNIRSIPRNLY